MNNNNKKKFLAYLMHDKKYISQSVGKITKKHLPHTYNVYELINRYFLKYGGIITEEVADNWFKKRKMNEDTIIKYKTIFSELNTFNNFDDEEFNSILDELNENFKRNKLLNLAEQIINKNIISCPENDLEKMTQELQETINDITISKDNVKDEGSIKNTIKERKEYYNKVKNDPNFLVTYPTGFKKIDNSSGGFAPGELIYIIGRKGDGKSTLMLNLAHNLWIRKYNVILFSIEISKKDYMRRFDARAAGISSNGLKRGMLTPDEEDIYNEYLQKMSDGLSLNNEPVGEFYVVDAPENVTPAFIEQKTKEVEMKLNIKFHVIISDYAGIMDPNIRKGELRHDKGEIALELKQIARKMEKVVITGEQMNRIGKNQKKTESDAVAESDEVSNHIDWGIAIKSLNEEVAVIESFKTRDTEPFEFHIYKRYNKLMIEEFDGNLDDWDDL